MWSVSICSENVAKTFAQKNRFQQLTAIVFVLQAASSDISAPSHHGAPDLLAIDIRA